jgi:hypothetical protein
MQEGAKTLGGGDVQVQVLGKIDLDKINSKTIQKLKIQIMLTYSKILIMRHHQKISLWNTKT